MIHQQTINWPNQRVPVFLCDAQYKLPSSAKLSNRSSFLAAFPPRYAVLSCRPVGTNLRVRGDKSQQCWWRTQLLYEPKAHFCKKKGVSCPRAIMMFHPLRIVYESGLALSWESTSLLLLILAIIRPRNRLYFG